MRSTTFVFPTVPEVPETGGREGPEDRAKEQKEVATERVGKTNVVELHRHLSDQPKEQQDVATERVAKTNVTELKEVFDVPPNADKPHNDHDFRGTHHDLVVVTEVGGRDGQQIARRIRSLGVYCEIWPAETSADAYRDRGVKGVVTGRESLDSSLDVPTFQVTDAAQVSDDDLTRFLDQCGCRRTWTMGQFVDGAVNEIRRIVGNGRVLSALSGGVDSSVASSLVHRAIGDQLTCIFVDHGFLRKGEARQVIDTFQDRFGSRFIAVDASDRFLSAVAGITDPEEKRKVIGREFIRVFEEEAAKLGDIDFLLQGTLYPDVIESGIGGAVVKSHHNVGGLPERMNLKLLEPLRYLFKDEVRALGEELGLPAKLIWRQPFPGPGLAIRIMGAVDRESVDIEREADAIVVEEIERAGLQTSVWQYFAVLTKTRAVGVGDDGRTYGYVAAVRAVQASDGMSALWAKLPHDLLDRIAHRIMTEVPQITRVVYDISSKPPATIEWE